MVDQTGRVVLLDFGFGKLEAGPKNPAGDATHPDTVLGSLAFIYPPLLFGEPATRRSDVFSAAATLYWTLTGEYLYDFVTRDPAEVVGEENIVPLSDRLRGYPRLCRVVDQALGLGPGRPCQTAREFQDLLRDPALLR
jgi:serine/threonine protein kinase